MSDSTATSSAVGGPPPAVPRVSPEIDKLLDLLVRSGGSDLHLAVGEPPHIRVNGKMKRIDMPALTQPQLSYLLGQIMPEDPRAHYEQDGDADFAYEAPGIGRFRCNVFVQKNGGGAVFRVVPTEVPSADAIGLPHTIRQFAMQHKGLVLVVGETGSGKSTTLAALVNIINVNRPCHVLTIEDPIEFVHKSQKALINQREVGQHTKSFARALKAALREDPDVILVGEMRDIETMRLAVTAAETGHLVLATLHSNWAHKAIDRIIDMFDAEQQTQIRLQLSETLKAVVAQQLIPRKDGKGRVAAFEILINNAAIANLIREAKSPQIRQVMSTSKAQGMQTMDAALADLIRKSAVDLKESLGRAYDRAALERELGKDGLAG